MEIKQLESILDQLQAHEAAVEMELFRSTRQIVSGKERSFLACVARIQPHPLRQDLEGLSQPDGVPENFSPSDEQYGSLSKYINAMLWTQFSGTQGSSITGSETFVSLKNGFPASHIAYLNGDRPVALKLWRREIESRLVSPGIAFTDHNIDLINRTLPQLVAETGDFMFLREIAECDKDAVRYAHHDRRGLSLLALAICAPQGLDSGHLSFLLEHRLSPLSRHPGIEPTIIDLALLSRNKDIVSLILQQRISCESYEMYVEKAIELGEAYIAHLFVPWLCEAVRSSKTTVERLTSLVVKKDAEWTEMSNSGMRTNQAWLRRFECWQRESTELVRALRKIVVQRASGQQIAADIDQVFHH